MDPISGSLLAASVGSSIYGMTQKPRGPSFGGLDALYTRRRQEIGDFANQLSMARQKYLTSLSSMYDRAYSRFAGNAEAKFASRGLNVSGGAFASTLAKESARYQSELEPLAFQAEREDARYVDDAYARAAEMNASGRAQGGMASFMAGREDSQALGGLMGNLTAYSFLSDGFGYGSPKSMESQIQKNDGSWRSYDSRPLSRSYGRNKLFG